MTLVNAAWRASSSWDSHSELLDHRWWNRQRLLTERTPVVRQFDVHLTLIVPAPRPGDQACGLEAFQQRGQGRGVESEERTNLPTERGVSPQRANITRY